MTNNLLTVEQISVIVNWMDTWDQLRGTAIPIRFIESFKNKSFEQIDSEIQFSKIFRASVRWECKVCGKLFDDGGSLYYHYDEEHNRAKE